jgi:hypothetical protein
MKAVVRGQWPGVRKVGQALATPFNMHDCFSGNMHQRKLEIITNGDNRPLAVDLISEKMQQAIPAC